ncbi:hypothetical protein RhiirA5_435643 [Rhizophagus irregularis]|uniref:Uncharacterized protein n=1 Tax=Rhizophagus irregularis TaxID=588596 RepID=A0A2N0NN54_9GLOM|nr:hypothetical protein RhiirA5_435643 [Rhizophagus irregularis]
MKILKEIITDFIYWYIADAGDNVITKVGAENFAAVVSDHASACTATKKELLNDTKYKHILPIRCITYHQSYQTGEELRSKITNEIKRDRLKTYVITRWTTAWDCTDSIL